MEKWISELYKSKGDFVKNKLENRRSILKNDRKDKRGCLLNTIRNIPENMSLSPSDNTPVKNVEVEKNSESAQKKNKRYEMLLKWREERDKKKAEAKKTQKPIFKVCHVQAKDDLSDALTCIKGKKIPLKGSIARNTPVPKISDKTKANEEPIDAMKNAGNSKSHIVKHTKKDEKNTLKNIPEDVKAVQTKNYRKFPTDDNKQTARNSRMNEEPLEMNLKRTLRQPKKNITKEVSNEAESIIQAAENRKKIDKIFIKYKNLKMEQQNDEIVESSTKMSNPLDSSIGESSSHQISSSNNSEKRNIRKIKEQSVKSPSVQTHGYVRRSARRNLKANFDTTQKLAQSKRETMEVRFDSDDQETSGVFNESIVPQPKNQRRAKRTLDMNKSEKNTLQVSDTLKSDELLSTSSSKNFNLKSETERKSILNTPPVEWKLILNETESNGNTPVASDKKKTTKRSLKPSNMTSTTSEEYFTPDKTDGNMTNNVFVTPTETSPMKEDNVAYVSPFVTMSRGKNAARKEYEERKSGNYSADSSNPTSPRAAAAYFTKILNNTISYIEEKCEIWKTFKTRGKLSEDACGLIDMTIGQSNLLITKKFNQFRGLIQKCQDNNESGGKVTCEDLHGFWDMIYKQVDDLDRRFESLEDMRKNNWLEKRAQVKKTVEKNIKKGNNKKTTGIATAGSSLLRETILAARRKKNDERPVDDEVQILVPKKQLNTPQMKADISTPGRGILKTDNTRSEKRKTVIFKEARRSACYNKENESTPTDGQKSGTPKPTRKSKKLTPTSIGNTPICLRRSQRKSLGSSKLMIE